MPEWVYKLNCLLDDKGIIRVKCKFPQWQPENCYPILIFKSSYITGLIVVNCHEMLAHAGIYALILKLRNRFIVSHFFLLKVNY